MFFCWKDYYQGSFFKKPDLSRAWEALPRFICWKIWTTRNKEIFEGKNTSTNKVVASAKALWVDTLAIRGMKIINNEPLTVEERAWMDLLLWNSLSSSKLNPPKMSTFLRWHIRMSNVMNRKIGGQR